MYLFENGYSDYNPDYYKLGTQYKDKLALNQQEVDFLNNFYSPVNNFNSIEGCTIAIINLLLETFNKINNKLKVEKSNLNLELKNLFNYVIEIENLEFDSQNVELEWKWAYSRFMDSFYLTQYKIAENLVREKFGHKRKLTFESYYPYTNSALIIEEKLGRTFQLCLEDSIANINNPDQETQIELNTQNVNRWQIEFNELKESFSENEKDKFIDSIIHLEETNQKNPNIENILFEASKFIAKYDKVQSLIYYAKYIYYDLKSKKFDNKELTKTVQKSLFKTEEQINVFRDIISDLIDNSDIQTAIEKISKIYVPKRKKIELDTKEIKAVEQKHEGTVELLNEYLESGKEEKDIIPEETFEDDVQIEIISKKENHSILKSEIALGKVQEELVKRIIANAFGIGQDEVDKYATENGMFKNQLIDSINEACQEFLDGEALIEEDENNYVIEESYYQEIAK